MRILPIAAVTLAGLTLCGCGSDPQEPTASFPLDGTRLYESYRQTGETSRSITIPDGTRSVRIKMDCIGTGEIKVFVARGMGGVPCSSTSQSDGYIGLEIAEGTSEVGATKLTVTDW